MTTRRNLTGRTALVTGGSRGLGSAIAQALLERGSKVAIAARGDANVKAAASRPFGRLERGGERPSQRRRRVGRRVGEERPRPGPDPDPVSEVEEAILGSVFDTKLVDFLRFVQSAHPFLNQEHGSVVNVARAIAHQLVPNASVMGIVNAGVVALTGYLASEAAPYGVRVNAISPGMTKTEGWLTKTEAMAEQQGKTAEEVRAAMTQNLGIGMNRWAEPSEIGARGRLPRVGRRVVRDRTGAGRRRWPDRPRRLMTARTSSGIRTLRGRRPCSGAVKARSGPVVYWRSWKDVPATLAVDSARSPNEPGPKRCPRRLTAG